MLAHSLRRPALLASDLLARSLAVRSATGVHRTDISIAGRTRLPKQSARRAADSLAPAEGSLSVRNTEQPFRLPPPGSQPARDQRLRQRLGLDLRLAGHPT